MAHQRRSCEVVAVKCIRLISAFCFLLSAFTAAAQPFADVTLAQPLEEASGSSAADSLDTFNRANTVDTMSNPMSDGVGTWEAVSGFAQARIASNEARAVGAPTCVNAVNSPAYNNNQWTSITIGSAGVTAYQGAICRMDSSTGAGYLLAVANSTTVELYLLPAVTLLDTFTTSSMVAGDVIRLEASGTSSTTLTFKKNGSTVDSYVHGSSTVTGGQPAFWLNNSALMDDFRCGNL